MIHLPGLKWPRPCRSTAAIRVARGVAKRRRCIDSALTNTKHVASYVFVNGMRRVMSAWPRGVAKSALPIIPKQNSESVVITSVCWPRGAVKSSGRSTGAKAWGKRQLPRNLLSHCARKQAVPLLVYACISAIQPGNACLSSRCITPSVKTSR